jgi:hypothetical protein
MINALLAIALAAAGAAVAAPDDAAKSTPPATAGGGSFHPPVRLKAGDEIIKVDAPGYACPCLADIDRDGKLDLLVGQFNEGKIRVYKGLGEMKFGPGEWLKADGEVALVPGVW